MGARKLQGRSSEGQGMMLKTTTKKNLACASESYGILKAKKEASAAVRLLRFNRVPGGSEMWMDEWREMKTKAAAEEEAARPVKKTKRKRVVKQRLPEALIHLMMARPFRSVEDLTPLQLAKRSREFRQYHPLTTFVDAKVRGYEQALIRQYNTVGYAEDEIEVTDSDSEEDASVVVN